MEHDSTSSDDDSSEDVAKHADGLVNDYLVDDDLMARLGCNESLDTYILHPSDAVSSFNSIDSPSPWADDSHETLAEDELLRKYGFNHVADALAALTIRFWIVSVTGTVLRVEYRWLDSNDAFRECEFEIRIKDSSGYGFGEVEVTLPWRLALPFQGGRRDGQIEFRLTRPDPGENPSGVPVHGSWVSQLPYVFHRHSVRFNPDRSWVIAADLLEEHGCETSSVIVRDYIRQLRPI